MKHPTLIEIRGFTGEREQQVNAILNHNLKERKNQVSEALKDNSLISALENIIHQYAIGEEAFKRFQDGEKQLSGRTESAASSSDPLLLLQQSSVAAASSTQSGQSADDSVSLPVRTSSSKKPS